MVKIIREVFAFILIQFYYILTRRNDTILSIYFHNPRKDVFENAIKWLIKKKYEFISTSDLYMCINKQIKKPGRLVCITFDDGWKGNLDLIKIIEKYQVLVTIFVPTDPVSHGNYWFEYAVLPDQKKITQINSKENFKKLAHAQFAEKVKILKENFNIKRSCFSLSELKEISKNKFITIGSHSVTHPILNNCSFENQQYELLESKNTLQDWIKKEVEFLAYPNGDFNSDTIVLAKSSGYKLGFSTELGEIDINKVNPFVIPRHPVHDTGGYYENVAKILGIWHRIFYKGKIFYKTPMN